LSSATIVWAQNDAALDIESSNQGVLLPRVALTSTNDVSTVPFATVSLLVFNTATVANVSPGYYYWDGSSWLRMETAQSTQTHYIGEIWGGGIVFYVYDNGQHGLIASLDDLGDSTGVAWGVDTALLDVPNCESQTDGMMNTASIIAAGGLPSEAAGLCDSFSAGGFTDWYLPAGRELYLLASHDLLIDRILDTDGNANTNGFSQEDNAAPYGTYWSSTESGYPAEVYCYNFPEGYTNFFNHKDQVRKVRAIRAF
jgi:hypothetical protein